MREGAIHDVLFYCTTPEFSKALLERVSDDYLFRVVDSPERLQTALDAFAPELLLAHVPTSEELDFLSELSSRVKLPNPVLLADPDLVRQPATARRLVELGLGQYISLPIEPSEFQEHLENYFAVRQKTSGPRDYKRRFSPGEPIFLENEFGGECFTIVSGRVRICRVIDRHTLQEVALLGPGETFGEMALLSTERRSGTALGVDDVIVTVTTQETFTEQADSDPYFVANLMRVLVKRIRDLEDRIPEIIPLEDGKDGPRVLRGVARERDRRFYAAGQMVFEAGEFAQCFYLVESGHLEVSAPDLVQTGWRKPSVTAGELAGDVAFVLKRNYGRTAMALQDTVCCVLKADNMAEGLRLQPKLYLRMAQGLTATLRERLELMSSRQLRELS